VRVQTCTSSTSEAPWPARIDTASLGDVNRGSCRPEASLRVFYHKPAEMSRNLCKSALLVGRWLRP